MTLIVQRVWSNLPTMASLEASRAETASVNHCHSYRSMGVYWKWMLLQKTVLCSATLAVSFRVAAGSCSRNPRQLTRLYGFDGNGLYGHYGNVPDCIGSDTIDRIPDRDLSYCNHSFPNIDNI